MVKFENYHHNVRDLKICRLNLYLNNFLFYIKNIIMNIINSKIIITVTIVKCTKIKLNLIEIRNIKLINKYAKLNALKI